MDLTPLEALAKKIQVNLFKSSSLLAQGFLRTPFGGAGLQFREHRVYVPGDDVRFLDWKMLAKTHTPYVKTFEEERKVDVVVFLDFRPSMLYGYAGKSKWEAAVEISALLSLLLEKSGDLFTLVLFYDDVYLLAGLKGKDGIGKILHFLEKKNLGLYSRSGKGLIPTTSSLLPKEKKHQEILRHAQKRKEILILSDFSHFFLSQDFKILHRPHLYGFQILSPLDLQEKVAFSLFGSSVKKNEKMTFHSQLQQRKNFTRLMLNGPYLDHFIREVVK